MLRNRQIEINVLFIGERQKLYETELQIALINDGTSMTRFRVAIEDGHVHFFQRNSLCAVKFHQPRKYNQIASRIKVSGHLSAARMAWNQFRAKNQLRAKKFGRGTLRKQFYYCAFALRSYNVRGSRGLVKIKFRLHFTFFLFHDFLFSFGHPRMARWPHQPPLLDLVKYQFCPDMIYFWRC